MPVIDPVSSDSDFPKKTTVAVIGGGVIGVATALELSERGVPVVLLEKGIIAGEQSSRNWGWCRQMGRDSREIPLILESLKLWREMNARVGTETGYRQCGVIYLAENEVELAAREKWYAENAKAFGLDTKLVSGIEAERLQPGSTRPWKGALYTSADGRAEPFIAVPAMARHAQKTGVKIFQNCAVRGVETAAGKIISVVTEKGTIACEQVVLAGGAWSRRFLHNLDIAFPQLTVVNSVMRTETLDAGVEKSCSAGKFAFRKREDGGYTIAHRHFSVADIMPDSFRQFFQFLPALKMGWSGVRLRLGRRFLDEARLKRRWKLDERSPFEEIRMLDPEPVNWILNEAAASLRDYYPRFQAMRIAERWAGVIDATPDVVPCISPLPKIEGLYLASGFSGHGFGLGPGAGKLMAQMVMGESPCVDPAPFRHGRFLDGSRPQPTTGL
jgi:glycine/D-amino acid oxidase-like deaminating enzyme